MNNNKIIFYSLLKNNYLYGKRINLYEENNKIHLINHCFRFKTNADTIIIKYSIKNIQTGNFPHLGITARQGFSILYKPCNSQFWKHIDCISSVKKEDVYTKEMRRYDIDTDFYEIMILSPILSDVVDLEIGVEKNYIFESIKKDGEKKVLLLGGPHTFGIGATSSALFLSNIIARKLDCIIYNIASYRKNYMQLILENMEYCNPFINAANIIVLEYDYLKQDINSLEKYVVPIIQKLIQNDVQVILWKSSFYLDNYSKEKETLIDKIIYNNNKIKKIIFDNVTSYETQDLYTYSENFINDAGHTFIAKQLLKYLR